MLKRQQRVFALPKQFGNSLSPRRTSQYCTCPTSKFKQSASLHALHLADAIQIHKLTRAKPSLAGQVEHLPAEQPANTTCASKSTDQFNANFGIRVCLFPRQHVERQSK